MSLSIEEVKKIAHLARLGTDTETLTKYAHDLSNILDFVAQMDKANTGDSTPMAHPFEMTQRFRSDQITETDQRELFQSIAPLTAAGLYLVPKVIE